MTRRIIAAAGTLAMAAALVILWIARLSIPGDHYVSELGAPGMPTAGWFEVTLLLIASGGSLIAWAGRGIRSRPRVLALWAPAVSLWISCGFFLIDSQVTCTPGCPVPVGPAFTWQDFVHTLSAVLAFGIAAWAIAQCAFAVGHVALRRFSLVSAIALLAISSAGGLMSLLHWQADFGSRLELAATTIGLVWILVFGTTLAVGPVSAAAHRGQQLLGQHDQTMDLVLVPVDPPALRLGADGDEPVVLLPDHEGALGTDHVLLPPHLPQVVARDAAPR